MLDLQEAKGVLQSYSDLVDLFESIRGSLERRKPQPGLRPTPEIMEIRRKIMYEIITVLALAAGEMMQRRRRMSFVSCILYDFLLIASQNNPPASSKGGRQSRTRYRSWTSLHRRLGGPCCETKGLRVTPVIGLDQVTGRRATSMRI